MKKLWRLMTHYSLELIPGRFTNRNKRGEFLQITKNANALRMKVGGKEGIQLYHVRINNQELLELVYQKALLIWKRRNVCQE